ncbi:allantoicase [Parahaliea maris]|uniref:Probable allantoicase n=1 Tax=Parahaliea maris TaxID=2716870 RepID=A0A5C9A6V5_9GAMM|nr:allantoicase [Parahaliea maris]TXS95317.1 allantoicase [Parahaliea maris]
MITDQFTRDFINLLSGRIGGRALSCSDQWFAEASNLVNPNPPIFRQGHFVATGQWMDGWESRRSFRRRDRDQQGVDYDWCILRLGIPGSIYIVDVETTHFRGNAPEYASLEGAWVEGPINDDTEWFSLLPKSALEANAQNEFAVSERRPCTHLRLKIFPDGGVARLRTWGRAKPRREHYVEGELVDLASAALGGYGQQCSDQFYSSPHNLVLPHPGDNMGDGWETRRRRDDGNDWCILRLGVPGNIRKVIVDTAHFVGNYPDEFVLEAACIEGRETDENTEWITVIDRTPLGPDRAQVFIDQILTSPEQTFTHMRLNIFPDGGVSRLRVIGLPEWERLK